MKMTLPLKTIHTRARVPHVEGGVDVRSTMAIDPLIYRTGDVPAVPRQMVQEKSRIAQGLETRRRGEARGRQARGDVVGLQVRGEAARAAARQDDVGRVAEAGNEQ